MGFKPIQAFRDTKLRTKLVLSYLCVMLLPVVLIGYFLISETISAVLERTNNINYINFQQMKNNLNNQLESYLNLSDSFLSENVIMADSFSSENVLMDYIEREYPPDAQYFDKYQDFQKVNDIYKRKVFLAGNGYSLMIYTSNTTLIVDNRFIRLIDGSIKGQKWYRDILDAKGKIVIYESYSDETSQTVISFGRLMNASPDNKFTNILIFQIPEASVYSLMEKEGINKDIFLIDDANNIISSTVRGSLGKKADDIPELKGLVFDSAATGMEKMESLNRMMFFGRFNEKNVISDWKVVSIVSSQAILKDISGIVDHSLLICIVSAIIAIIFIVLFSNALTKRLKLMVKNMGRIKDGKFDVFVNSRSKDEIGELAESFKNMVDRINNLINEVYVLEIKKKEAEINALQSQINPHFLFNTMESIRMNLIWQKQDNETAAVVQKFAKLLRKSIDWANDKITIKKEIELVGTYLDIQKYRYGEKLEYDIEIDDKLYNSVIPKFTLQPIVENAIYHGIEMKKGKGKVRICSQILETVFKIIVEDDGVGMDESTLNNVREQIYGLQQETEKTRIGIRNVHQRLRLHYGDQYGVFIDSSKDSGTVVEILMPLDAKGGGTNV